MVGYGSNNAADLLVIFGITGDLARKMTLRALYRLECRKLLDCPILGVASRQRSGDELLELARQAISGSGEEIDEDVFNRFLGRLSYVLAMSPEIHCMPSLRSGSGHITGRCPT